MECREFAAASLEAGDSPVRAPDPRVRLWLKPRRRPSSKEVEWDLFHDDERVGTHARVGRGLLERTDGSRREVAVKLRRDQPLGPPVDPGEASLRFWREYTYHKILRERSGPETIPRVVNTEEHRTSADLTHPDVLPPCAVCLHARHAIALKGKGEILIEGDARGFERRLTGKIAGQHWWSRAHHYDEVLDASLGYDDSACRDCPLRGDAPAGCRDQLVYINFYPNEFLIFPVWEMSLEQLLARSNSEAAVEDPRRHLGLRLAAAHDVALGLRSLHAAKIWHHDLNPENILLGMSSRRFHAAIIDLGLSSSAEDRSGTAGSGPGDASNLWPRRLSYAAWECRQDALEEPIRIRAKRIGPDRAVFELNQSSLNWLDYDPPVCPGDRIVWLAPGRTGQALQIRDVERSAAGDILIFDTPPDRALEDVAEFVIERQRGPAADLFSLGMVMIALLLDHPQGRPIRREIEHAQDVVATLASGPGSVSPFELSTALLAHSHALSSTGKRFFHGRLARYGIYEQLARRALGLALSLTLRGPARCGTVTVDRRRTEAEPALDKVCKLLELIFQESKTSTGRSSVNVGVPTSWQAGVPTRRTKETLPEDWLQFLPFWTTIRWSGKPQVKLSEYLRSERLKLTPDDWEVVHEFQAAENAISVIKDFLVALIRFQEQRPTGLWARWFRKSERQMPAEVAALHVAALSALERLGHSAGIAATWVEDLQGMYRSARDRWLAQRSPGEAALMGKEHLRTVEDYWEQRFPNAFDVWRLEWTQLFGRLKDTFEFLRAWWPGELATPNRRKMTDVDLAEVAHLSHALLVEVLPVLSGNLMGPAGDVRALWIMSGES